MNVETCKTNLRAYLTVCDANYIRLLKLLGPDHSCRQRIIMLPPLTAVQMEDAMEKPVEKSMEKIKWKFLVRLEVIRRFRYTSVISIGQNRVSAPFYETPEMLVRAYHDLRTAEVISYQNHHSLKTRYPLSNPRMYQRNEKEQWNLFLADWLHLCLSEGLPELGDEHLAWLGSCASDRDDRAGFSSSSSRSRIATKGDKPRIATKGDKPRIATKGDKPRIATKGDKAACRDQRASAACSRQGHSGDMAEGTWRPESCPPS